MNSIEKVIKSALDDWSSLTGSTLLSGTIIPI